ncbi:M56 family peptidase [Microbacterium esteraromaticum]|nr:M56 family peptidase [Microbacterium esteraromaticum]
MTIVLVPLLFAAVLVTAVLGGPRLVRAAAPALMRAPRTAVALLLGAGALWLLASAALILMLAWLISGPAILPASITGVCQRCLAASSPFSSAGVIETFVPAALLLVLPAIGLAVLLGIAVFRGLRRRRVTVATANDIAARAQHANIDGYPVLLTGDAQPTAYSLPQRHGGIVISHALIATLRPDELAAVLAHEQEHVHGRHHLVLALIEVALAPLHWLPLMSAIRNAVPHYLEIAADNAAQRHAGTPTLASALLKLGNSQTTATASGERGNVGVLLHAAGPDRIRHLISPPRIGSAIAPLSALGVAPIVFAVATAAVHGPYISVIITGCPLMV